MPLTAKFSESFYRQLGHEVVDELVDFMNRVDATYRTDLREVNEHNFARFADRLDALRAHTDGRLDALRAHTDALKLHLDDRIEALTLHVDDRIDVSATRLEGRLATLLERTRADMIKWMFVFWTGTTITVVGTLVALN